MSWTRNWYVRAALYCFMQLRPTPVGCCCSRQGSTPGGAIIAGEPLRSTAEQLAGRVITPRPAPIFGMYAGRQSVNTAKGASHGSAEVWRFLRLRQKCPASIILAAHCLTQKCYRKSVVQGLLADPATKCEEALANAVGEIHRNALADLICPCVGPASSALLIPTMVRLRVIT